MKRILIFSLVLASIAGASGWDIGMNATGQGVATFDSIIAGVGRFTTSVKTPLITSTSGASLTFTATDTIGITLFRKGTFVDTLFVNNVIKSKSVATSGITKNNYVVINGTKDGPAILFSDSTSGSARVVDSVYSDAGYFNVSHGSGLRFLAATGPRISPYSGFGLYTVMSATEIAALYGGATPLNAVLLGAGVDSSKGIIVDNNGFRGKKTGGVGAIDTVKAGLGLKVGTGTMLLGVYTGNATGWTLQNTIDTNLISGATATSRSVVQMKAATATLTAPLCCRTTADTLFISCAAADTAAVRAGSVDYLIFK